MARAERRGRPRGASLVAAMLACATGLLLGSMPAAAGLLLDDVPEGGYKEDAAPPPPTYSVDKLVPIALPVSVATLTVGIDPTTLMVGSDGVVRYVAVMRSPSGTFSAIYEGIRCASAEVKIYARHYTDGTWHPVDEPKWQSLYDAAPSRYSLPIAKAGVCHDAAPNGSAQQILLDLRDDTTRVDPRR